MDYIYDEETNLIMQHNRKENQTDLPAKAFWCKRQNPTLASKQNEGKKGFNGRMQLLTEMKGRLKKVRSPGAATISLRPSASHFLPLKCSSHLWNEGVEQQSVIL